MHDAKVTVDAKDKVLRVEGGKGWIRTNRFYCDLTLEWETRGDGVIAFRGGLVVAVSTHTGWTDEEPWLKWTLVARGAEASLRRGDSEPTHLDLVDVAPGYIGIQANDHVCEFRSIRIKALTSVDPSERCAAAACN